MTRFYFLAALFFVLIAGAPAVSVHAAEPEPGVGAEGAGQKDSPKPDTSEARETFREVSKFMMSLEDGARQHFYLIYSNYNMMRAVASVRESVLKAVDACSEHNPDMEKKLRDRFAEWDGAVQPVYEEAEAGIDNMIIAQDYASADELRSLLKGADAVRDNMENQFDKIPVTTPEACEFMLGKMDETQDNMVALLRATMVNYPQSLPGYVPPEKTEEKDG